MSAMLDAPDESRMSQAHHQTLARLHRQHYRDVLAPLIRILGSFEAAEEVAQEAFIAAHEAWQRDGLPDEPLAWLRRTARNRAIDGYRRGARWKLKEDVLRSELPGWQDPPQDTDELEDDVLRLVFTCCHPALALEARIALTLHTVCGLTSEQVARAFLVPRTTLQQRLVRAKRKIDGARIPYQVPDRKDLPDRLSAVLHTIYLVFNEGYGATDADGLLRRDLCEEAIRLARLLLGLLPGHPSTGALLALMLLHHSRSEARTDSRGELVTLEDQDRSLWDQEAIGEALPMVEAALRARPVPPYAIEAAIVALHAHAARAEDTDWAQITGLYGVLLAAGSDPITELNAAVAMAMSGRLDEGLARLDALEAGGGLRDYHLLPAARADLLRRVGRGEQACAAYEQALSLVSNPVERRYLERRHREVSGQERKNNPAAVDRATVRSSPG